MKKQIQATEKTKKRKDSIIMDNDRNKKETKPMVYKTPYENYNVDVCVSTYADDGCLALWLIDADDGSSVAVLSVNLMVPALNGYIYMDNEYNQAQWGIDFLETYGLGKATGRAEKQGFGTFPLVKANLERLLEVASNRKIAEEVLVPMIEIEKIDKERGLIPDN